MILMSHTSEPSDVPILTPSELGALLQQSTPRLDKACLQCKIVMPAVTLRREFCSARCRQKHWRARYNASALTGRMVYVAPHLREGDEA